MPQISVILPVFNGEKYIIEAVDSILKQSFTNFEIVIVNDASTDNTAELLSSIDDSRVRIITNEKNLHISKSLNKAIALAHGQYIARMDGDDIAHKDRLKLQLKCLEENPEVGFCLTWVETFGQHPSIRRGYIEHCDIKANLLFLNTIYHPTVMFRKDVFLNNNLRYNEDLRLLEDYNLWIDAMQVTQFKTIPQVLLKYREHDTNVSVANNSNRSALDLAHTFTHKRLLDALKINYTDSDLKLHRNIGIRQVDYQNVDEIKHFISWLTKIYQCNRKVRYFNNNSLKTVLISNLLFAIYQVRFSPKELLLLTKALLKFNIKDYFSFFNKRLLLNLKYR